MRIFCSIAKSNSMLAISENSVYGKWVKRNLLYFNYTIIVPKL